MLNYVAAYLLTYLIFNSRVVLARDEGLQRERSSRPARRCRTPRSGPAATIHAAGRHRAAARRGPRRARRGAALGALLADAVRLRGAGARRLAARGALRGHAHAPQDPRGDGDLGRDRRARRREPGRRLPRTRSTPTRTGCRSSTTATPGSSSPRSRATTRSRSSLVAFLDRRAAERGQHAPGRRLPVRARRRDPGAHPLLGARRRAARPLPRPLRSAARRGCAEPAA